MLRHRQDELPSLAQDNLTGVGLYGAESNNRAKQYIREHPDVPDAGSYGSSEYGSVWTVFMHAPEPTPI